MYIDAQNLFSDAQALTGTAASTNLIDLGQPRRLFEGDPMCVVLQVDVAADFTTGDETYTFALQTDDNSAFSSAATIFSLAILTTSLTAGAVIVLPVGNIVAAERFVRLNYTLAGTTPTLTLTAWLAPQWSVQKYFSHPDAITIS